MNASTVTILVVDDDDVDVESLQRAFSRRRIANPIEVAHDGEEALQWLRARAGQPSAGPVMVLLDLNMPRMNGIEFLQHLRNDDALKRTVVFVLTTSSDDRDKLAAYNNHVAGYLLKRNVGADFVDLMGLLGNYWRYVEFPPQRSLP